MSTGVTCYIYKAQYATGRFMAFQWEQEKKKSRDEWELKKREAFSFDVLSYHSTIGGVGGMTTFFSVTSSTGHIMLISGTVDEGLFAWL